jgi:hypothetical protein
MVDLLLAVANLQCNGYAAAILFAAEVVEDHAA